MASSTNLADFTHFFRHPEIQGLELRRVVDVVSAPRTYFSRYRQFLISTSWSGTVWHRQLELTVRPGDVLEARPGELMISRKGYGELHYATVSQALCDRLTGAGEAWNYRDELPLWACVQRLQQCLADQVLVEAAECSLRQLLSMVTNRRASLPRSGVDWEETREMLQRVGLLDDATFDLEALSRFWGRSRFSALRTFKRRFGLPPLSYQIHLRVEQAQLSLCAGERPARVAADCGFFDQSHLTRHFKRLLGITPAQYARAGAKRSPRADARAATSEASNFAGQELVPLRRISQFFPQKIDHGSYFGRQLSH